MWMEKIRHGVLQVSSDTGTRYVSPRLLDRIRLVWTFRNFTVLPEEVLSPQVQHVVDELCQHTKRESRTTMYLSDHQNQVVIGVVEKGTVTPWMQAAAKKACGSVSATGRLATSTARQ
jgi:hypothetical protein